MKGDLRLAVALLRCPTCAARFSMSEKAIRCDNGHSFDLARQGYVNLASPYAAKLASDTREMVQARRRFLASGLYDPLGLRIAQASQDALPGLRNPRVIDLGCGPGHYLAHVVAGVGEARALGIDLSKEAIRAATAAVPSAAFVVGDVGTEIPVADDSFDLGINVFAPRAVPEWRRLLRAPGTMLVVMAGPDHLTQLIERFDLLKVGPDKHERLLDQLRDDAFEVDSIERVTYEMAATGEQVSDLILMGPNYWHLEREERLETEPMDLTVDVVLTVASLRA